MTHDETVYRALDELDAKNDAQTAEDMEALYVEDFEKIALYDVIDRDDTIDYLTADEGQHLCLISDGSARILDANESLLPDSPNRILASVRCPGIDNLDMGPFCEDCNAQWSDGQQCYVEHDDLSPSYAQPPLGDRADVIYLADAALDAAREDLVAALGQALAQERLADRTRLGIVGDKG